MRREHDAVAGVTIHNAELVQLSLGQVAEQGFTLSLAFHVPQAGSGLVSQYLLAKSIEPALLAIVAGVRFHQFHPLSVGDQVVLSLSATTNPARACSAR